MIHAMSPSFRKLSIKHKLRLIIILTSGVALLLASSAFVINDLLEFRKTMVRELFVLADLIGLSTAPGLLFKDPDTVETSLNVLQADRRIMLTHIFDDRKSRFTTYFRAGLALPEVQNAKQQPFVELPANGVLARHSTQHPRGRYWFGEHSIDVVAPIYFQGDLVGYVYLRSDLTQFQRHLQRAGSIVIGILGLSLFLSVLLASRFQRVVTQPVENLLATMREVPATQDYSLRAHKITEDELGDLVDGFNRMLSQIERRDSQLQEYREHLRDMVQKRTAELEESRDQAVFANEALRRRTDELALARERAEAANRAKSAFLANMSHELRTPLNGILGYAQILNQDVDLSVKQKEGVRVIQSSGDYLLTLINDVLDLSKIEAGKIELHPTDFAFLEFIDGIADLFRMRARQKKIDFVLELPASPPFYADGTEDLPVAVHADEKRLRQILFNLLGNALKFTPKGEVRLRVGHARPGVIRFEVRDTGVGIAPGDRDKIFMPFQQVGDVLQKAEGTGLGLSITKRLLAMMSSDLALETEPGRGSCFRFDLELPPAIQPLSSARAGTRAPHGYQRTEGTAPLRVLVCDDKPENRAVLRNLLEPLGFEVAEASDGDACVAVVATRVPDLLFIDLFMPGMNGLTATKTLRANPAYQDLPIIAASASVFASHRADSLEAGCNDFLPKPIQAERLYHCLETHLPLRWLRVTEEETNDEPPSRELIPPDRAILQALYDLAMRGNIRAIQQKVVELAASDLELAPFCERIETLAKAFREEEICTLLETLLETSPS